MSSIGGINNFSSSPNYGVNPSNSGSIHQSGNLQSQVKSNPSPFEQRAQGGPNVPQAAKETAQNALAPLKDVRQWAMSNIYQSPSEPAPQESGQGGGSQAPSIDSKSFVQRAQQSAQDHPGLRPLINSMFQDARYSPGISNSGTGTNTSNSSST